MEDDETAETALTAYRGVGVEVTKGLEDARIALNKRRSPLASKLAGLVIAN